MAVRTSCAAIPPWVVLSGQANPAPRQRPSPPLDLGFAAIGQVIGLGIGQPVSLVSVSVRPKTDISGGEVGDAGGIT